MIIIILAMAKNDCLVDVVVASTTDKHEVQGSIATSEKVSQRAYLTLFGD